MPAFLNQYYQLFFDFLDKNPATGSVYLNATDYQGYTWLTYDTNDKYLIQDMEFLEELPRLRLYGAVVQEWWQLLAVYGHVRNNSMNWLSATSLPVDRRLAQAAQERVRHGLSAQGRRATLQPRAEDNLFKYLKQQLTTATYAYPTKVAIWERLSELHNEADEFAEELNERIQRTLLSSLHHRLSFETTILSPRQSLHLLHTRAHGDGTPVPYTFEDGVTVYNVQQQHLRPFQFAGAWVTLPDDPQEALPVMMGFTDSRKKIIIPPDEMQSQQLTAQWCLEKGYQQITLAPNARNLVEEFGADVPGQPTKRWLTNGHLAADLAKCYKLLHAPHRPVIQEDCNEKEDDLPF